MPLIRKVIDVGKTSKGVILPKSWLKYYEQEKGKPVNSVAIEVNKVLVIKPIFSKLEKDQLAVEGQGQVDPSTGQPEIKESSATNERTVQH